MHEKDLWEIILGGATRPKIKFGKILSQGTTHEHCMLIKKNKLACGTIFLNVVDSLLHHATHAKSVREAWENLGATTFEIVHVDNRLKLQKFYNLKMEEGISMQVHIDKLQMIVNQLTNIENTILMMWHLHF